MTLFFPPYFYGLIAGTLLSLPFERAIGLASGLAPGAAMVVLGNGERAASFAEPMGGGEAEYGG